MMGCKSKQKKCPPKTSPSRKTVMSLIPRFGFKPINHACSSPAGFLRRDSAAKLKYISFSELAIQTAPEKKYLAA
jgi:hypothetical protein